MAHDHHGHDHAHDKSRTLGAVALLTGGFMLAEVAGGLISGSLALLADAGHMLTDFASLALAWLAARVAARPADWQRTYGFNRFSVMAAFVNGLALFAIAAWIVVEAIGRLIHPHPVLAGPMLIIAVLGLIVNVIAFRLLHGGHDHDDLNVQSAALHVLGDLLGSVAAIAAAGVIWWTGWTPIDPLLSVLVVVLILGAAWRVVGRSGRILLEAAPAEHDARAISDDLAAVPGVASIYHVHVWSIDERRPMITLHARLGPEADHEDTRRALRTRLADAHGIGHSTIEIETPGTGEPKGKP